MELMGFSERYGSCRRPLCTHADTPDITILGLVTLLIPIYLTLLSWSSEGCTRLLAG